MLPGVEIVYRPTRVYPHIDLGCHLLGYLREVSKQRLAELQIQEGNGIGLGDYIGVWGIEQVMDADLRGISGSRPVIEDAFGRDLGEATTNLLPSMQKRKAVPGKNLFLTVDMDLQKVAEQSFTGEAGAAIAIDPIGSCIGQRGSRITTIIEELGGEKIDVIQYNEDPAQYIMKALSPAKVLRVELNESDKTAVVHVAPDQFSLAIGRSGQNVRLASELTGWKLNVKEEGGTQEVSTEEASEVSSKTEEKMEEKSDEKKEKVEEK
jgi:predicted PilT family ATPase